MYCQHTILLPFIQFIPIRTSRLISIQTSSILPIITMSDPIPENKTHILSFTYDDSDACALTVLVNDVRFHITVSPSDLQKSREKSLYYDYLDKITALRDAERREEEEVEKQQCVGKNTSTRRSNDKDSAVDMTADSDSDQDQDSPSASLELQNWMLDAFADVTATWAPPNRDPIDSTLYEWYHGPTYFYSLQIKSGHLSPEVLETTSDLTSRIDALVPRLHMPKYIQSLPLPWISASDLTVFSEVSHPEPAHPGEVIDKNGKSYFFKPVVPSQPGPVKREINILQKLSSLDLSIKVPELLGFVSFESSNTEAMGFLLTPIPNATPLTKLLKNSVPRAKRAEWASKSEKYVKTLHDHNIIWGDAKADNFLIDENDELWIIDFGGSYTEGWVDPELSETKEGDDMGVDKVVRALEDPVGNTFDPALSGGAGGDDVEDAKGKVKETASGLFVTERVEGKRKRSAGGGKGEERGERKRAREDNDDSGEGADRDVNGKGETKADALKEEQDESDQE